MARKIRSKLITELREQAASRRVITPTRHMSMGSAYEALGIPGRAWHNMGPDQGHAGGGAYRLLCPDKHRCESAFAEPDRDCICKEMARVGANLRPLRDGRKTERGNSYGVAVGRTKSCEGCGARIVADNLAKRIEHEAGASCETGRIGLTIGERLADPATGEASKIRSFAGVLPFGRKARFEPTLDMEERVCKTALVKRPREGEIVLSDAYEALGERCMTAIMPAQVRKPKQKASVEGAVKGTATWVIAKPRNHVAASFEEVVAAVRGCQASATPILSGNARGAAMRCSRKSRRPGCAHHRRSAAMRPGGRTTAPRTSASMLSAPRIAAPLPSPSRMQGRSAAWRIRDWNLPCRRACGSASPASAMRCERMLHRPRPHAGGLPRVRTGQCPHQALGIRDRPGPHDRHRASVRLHEDQGAGHATRRYQC